jgi:hypothetical protein
MKKVKKVKKEKKKNINYKIKNLKPMITGPEPIIYNNIEIEDTSIQYVN